MRILLGFKRRAKLSSSDAEVRRAVRKKKRQESAPPIKIEQKRRKKVKISSPVDYVAPIWGADVGVDLGTKNVLIYVKRRGIVLNEPSYVARYVKSKQIIAVGEAARVMLGRTPAEIEVIRPIREGVIADYDTTEYMLRYFMERAIGKSSWIRPRVAVSIPSGVTAVEKRAVVEACLHAGARKTVLIEEPLAAALGTGLDKAKSAVAMVVDVGGGTVDIAVVSATGIVVSESLRLGGDSFDLALVKYFRKRKKLLVGMNAVEKLKIEVGTVDRRAPLRESFISGRDLITGLPKTIVATSKDVQRSLENSVHLIMECVKGILEKTPPEMVADIVDHGIILTGGGALIDGFDRMLTRSTGIAAYLSDEPLYSVVVGTGRALEEMGRLRDVSEEIQ